MVRKELSVAAENVSHLFLFESPYEMLPHGSDDNGLNWGGGQIAYYKLNTVVSEAVARIRHL